MHVTAAHVSIVSVEQSERKVIRVLSENAKTESIVSEVLHEASHDGAENIPQLVVQ